MSKSFFVLILITVLTVNVHAAEFTAPQVPEAGRSLMPEDTGSFGKGLEQIFQKSVNLFRPDLVEACRTGLAVLATVLTVAIVQSLSGPVSRAADLAGAAAIGAILLGSADSLIRLGSDTISQMSQYGKLLLPVLSGGLAAQGSVTASAALYSGTLLFTSVLSSLISRLFVPLVYLFLALSIAAAALTEDLLKRLRDSIKSFTSWSLKLLLTLFTAYMSITGVISGSTDAAALKATKVTVSTFVPVVGGILSDASEAILVSARLAKNAAGLYGIFAILSLFLEPFLKIASHYLVLKVTAFLCGLSGTRRMSDLVQDFSAAMGLLLAMTGSGCLLQLISTVCFLKGVGQ